MTTAVAQHDREVRCVAVGWGVLQATGTRASPMYRSTSSPTSYRGAASLAGYHLIMPAPTPKRTASSPTARARSGTPPPHRRAVVTSTRHGAASRGGSPVEFRGFVARQRTFSGDDRAGAYLREAALRGDMVGTVRWLSAGAEQAAVANNADPYGTTALHNACQYNRAEVVKALLASGADCNAADSAGRTPFHRAYPSRKRLLLLRPFSQLLIGLCVAVRVQTRANLAPMQSSRSCSSLAHASSPTSQE